MSIFQIIKESTESLLVNKLRTCLTVLGIMIGVAAVIAMLSIGRGAESSITGQIQGEGTNLVYVMPSNQQGDIKNPKPLTLSDAEVLADPLNAPSIEMVAPVLYGNVSVTTGRDSFNVTFYGVTPDFEKVANEGIIEGEFITEDQNLARSAVAVIGVDTANNLFDRSSGVTGETIRISGQPFQVIGVLEPKGSSGMGSQDDRIIIPITTAQSRLIKRSNPNEVDFIEAQATSPETVNSAVEEIGDILRTRHRTEVGLDDFDVFTQESILSIVQSVTGILTLFLGGVAAISLLVGGIGIMNIMLVSVTERTREIGLRKALGARKRDILIQFLTESVLVSMFGGLVGILLGWGISTIVGAIAQSSGTPFNPVITPDAILLATAFSTAIGLIFGLYPANRAANMQPVEALRYE